MASLTKMRCGNNPLIHATNKMVPERAVSRLPRYLGLISTKQYGVKRPGSRREASSVSTKQPINLNASIASKLSLEGKVTLITVGGTRGIGLALAEATAGLGSEVAILDIMEPQVDINKLQSQYRTRIKYFKADVTQKKSLENAFSSAAKEFGHIDNCVTAAGLALDKPFLEYGWEESRRILDINVIGSFFSAQLAARQMMEQGSGGSIVMISSMAGHCAIPSQRFSIYGASKAAIKLLGKSLAVEMAPHNIRINTLSPGYVATDIAGELTSLEEIVNLVPPMGRIGQRDDLTMAVAYLLSEGASYTTGADIAVAGGLPLAKSSIADPQHTLKISIICSIDLEQLKREFFRIIGVCVIERRWGCDEADWKFYQIWIDSFELTKSLVQSRRPALTLELRRKSSNGAGNQSWKRYPVEAAAAILRENDHIIFRQYLIYPNPAIGEVSRRPHRNSQCRSHGMPVINIFPLSAHLVPKHATNFNP
ncbi:hypothetical protein ACJ72_00577 [Emergomyces africanus]|uniref:Uncharacterized protein n=1 Tax=Emergomyces africanus TaxID=1955775 RepID=A0A1B7P817_9EURO|nr:hypothetical protein ACJ72_00577 [Emergomyces africanus]